MTTILYAWVDRYPKDSFHTVCVDEHGVHLRTFKSYGADAARVNIGAGEEGNLAWTGPREASHEVYNSRYGEGGWEIVWLGTKPCRNTGWVAAALHWAASGAHETWAGEVRLPPACLQGIEPGRGVRSKGVPQAEKAYFLRASGLGWADVCVAVGTWSHARDLSSGVKTWARKRGMAWPPQPDETVAPTKSKLEGRAQQEGRMSARYEAMRDPDTPLHGSVSQWASDRGLPWPPSGRSMAERAYVLRSEGLSWIEVTEQAGFKYLPGAVNAARRWAGKHGLEWPLAVARLPDPRSDTLNPRHQKAFELHRDGSSWGEVASILGYSSRKVACSAAHAHIKKLNRLGAA